MPRETMRATAEFHFLPFDRYPVSANFLTDRGPVRTNNEDSASVVIPASRQILESKGVLAVVADGMGGHEGGEVASSLATEHISKAYYDSTASAKEALADAFQGANKAIFEKARKDRSLAGMGTTCTAVAVVNGLAWAAHVGDSRIYLVRGGEPYRMTEDHSATMQLVNSGMITLAEAAYHEDRNVILRAMGTHAKLEVAFWKEPFPLRPGDRLVLCSDGLYEVITDDEIAKISSGAAETAQGCTELITMAAKRETTDNITVAILHVGQAEAS